MFWNTETKLHTCLYNKPFITLKIHSISPAYQGRNNVYIFQRPDATESPPTTWSHLEHSSMRIHFVKYGTKKTRWKAVQLITVSRSMEHNIYLDEQLLRLQICFHVLLDSQTLTTCKYSTNELHLQRKWIFVPHSYQLTGLKAGGWGQEQCTLSLPQNGPWGSVGSVLKTSEESWIRSHHDLSNYSNYLKLNQNPIVPTNTLASNSKRNSRMEKIKKKNVTIRFEGNQCSKLGKNQIQKAP